MIIKDTMGITAISIHALLAESDREREPALSQSSAFLSTLSLRRATSGTDFYRSAIEFLSTLSLRRATTRQCCAVGPVTISIHALLAESDAGHPAHGCRRVHFYPRSPCGERRYMSRDDRHVSLFLSTLSLRRATEMPMYGTGDYEHFYPRSPCGERLHYDNYNLHCTEISIHALLAESDSGPLIFSVQPRNFYPRSPCGERRRRGVLCYLDNIISIHALLAESDLATW